MQKKILFLLSVIFSLALVAFLIRFAFGGDEDTWIKEDNQWVKHGNPSSSVPNN
ncbi:MAG: hypothetical protein WAX66_01785 [Patescibacteria group bacterium]